MSKPALNNYSTYFVVEDAGVELASITTDGDTFDEFGTDRYNQIVAQLTVTNVAGTNTPTLMLRLQTLLPDETTFSDLATTALVTAAGKYIIAVAPSGNIVYTEADLGPGETRRMPIGSKCRFKAYVTGTNPVFTCSIAVRLLTAPLSISI